MALGHESHRKLAKIPWGFAPFFEESCRRKPRTLPQDPPRVLSDFPQDSPRQLSTPTPRNLPMPSTLEDLLEELSKQPPKNAFRNPPTFSKVFARLLKAGAQQWTQKLAKISRGFCIIPRRSGLRYPPAVDQDPDRTLHDFPKPSPSQASKIVPRKVPSGRFPGIPREIL